MATLLYNCTSLQVLPMQEEQHLHRQAAEEVQYLKKSRVPIKLMDVEGMLLEKIEDEREFLYTQTETRGIQVKGLGEMQTVGRSKEEAMQRNIGKIITDQKDQKFWAVATDDRDMRYG